MSAVALAVAGVVAGGVLTYSGASPDAGDTGDTVRIDVGAGRAKGAPVDAQTELPTGPAPELRIAATIPEDGSKVLVTTLAGKKSGFTGKVWLWLPPQYKEERYAHSGFPVMIALPGGPGFPVNYWMDRNLKLEASISRWSKDGSSLPFILAMPVLNPQTDGKEGLYWDGSDIPGQPRMGTWLTEDVPDLVRSAFRTIKSRDGWAFMGSSTGGFAGLKAVLQKPDRFKAVIAGGRTSCPTPACGRGIRGRSWRTARPGWRSGSSTATGRRSTWRSRSARRAATSAAARRSRSSSRGTGPVR